MMLITIFPPSSYYLNRLIIQNTQCNLPIIDMDLSEAMHEIIPGNVITIASRPALGKTYTTLKIIKELSKSGNPKVLYFTRDTQFDNAYRMIRQMHLSSYVEIREAQDFFNNSISLANGEIPSLMVIDTIDALVYPNTFSVAQTMVSLKATAQQHNIPVILTSWVNRRVENKKNRRPSLKDICYSKATVKHSDSVLLLYRERYYNRDCKYNRMEINIAKSNFT